MKHALIITGVLAALAITTPKLVVLGYFLLVVPGLILTVAPTLFAYLAATACIRRILPIASPVPANLLAFGAALLLGWAVMQPFRLTAMTRDHDDRLVDIVPEQAIKLTGHVRIERLDEDSEPQCDYLSLAVLDSPDVQTLTTVTNGRGTRSLSEQSSAYAIVPAKSDTPPGIFPTNPGKIVREFPSATRGLKQVAAAEAIEATWAIRLARSERLQSTQPVDANVADWVIRIDNQHDRTTALRRVTILDANDTVHFRKTYAKNSVPARMFYFGCQTNLSGASFHISRETIVTGHPSFKPETTLLAAINFSLPPFDVNATEILREEALRALDDPAATAVRLGLARRYLGLFFFNARKRDYALIARIVADDRVKDIEAMSKKIFANNKTPALLKDAYLERLSMPHTSASLRHWLAKRLASLSPGAFREPSPAYHAIWKSREIYQDAGPLVATLADLGHERAMPRLNGILTDTLDMPKSVERRALVSGIRAAFVRLGPQASSAAPRIRELFLLRPSPILNNASDADQWRFALARMGVPIEDLPFFASQSPRSVAYDLKRVTNRLEKYHQEIEIGQEI